VFGGIVVLVILAVILGVVTVWANDLYVRVRYHLRLMLRRFGVSTPLPSVTPEEWVKLFTAAGPHTQASLIENTTHESLKISRAEYLRLLVGCERSVGGRPADNIYWKVRHELEEALRLERPAEPGPPAAVAPAPGEGP
jgi:hypothetical protein